MAKKPDPVLENKKMVNIVHQDRNWVYRINNQLEATSNWNHQWGYLQGGIQNVSEEKAAKTEKISIDDQIKLVQAKISEMDNRNIMSTTNSTYGTGGKLEIFKNDKYNILKNKDLRPLERRLPKNWKKQKWTPPQDPFDELKNLTKKKR